VLNYSQQPIGSIQRPTPKVAQQWSTALGLVFVWLLPFAILSVIVGVLTGTIFWPYIGWLAAPWAAFFTVYCLYRWVKDTRQTNGRRIVGYVETAVRLNLPLPPFLLAAQRSESGRTAQQLGRLRMLLKTGLPVGMALHELADVPADVAERTAAGEALGQLRPTLMRTLEQQRLEAEEKAENPDAAVYRFYPLFLLLSMCSVVLVTMVLLVPKFKDIFKDFKTTLPHTTEILIAVSDWFVQDWGWLILAPLLLLMVAGILFAMSCFATHVFMPAARLPNFRGLWDWIVWRTPLAREVVANRGMVESCELLAGALREGVTLPAALERAVVLPVNAGFRKKLEIFCSEIAAGTPACVAARRAHLPELLVGLLAAGATGNEGQAAMYAFLARYYRQRASRLVLFLRSAWEPAAVLACGAFIGFIVVSLFLPLVKLIASVSGTNDGGAL
jgi:type IV pilus assembly protein PilC